MASLIIIIIKILLMPLTFMISKELLIKVIWKNITMTIT
jgi:hypothetical protein